MTIRILIETMKYNNRTMLEQGTHTTIKEIKEKTKAPYIQVEIQPLTPAEQFILDVDGPPALKDFLDYERRRIKALKEVENRLKEKRPWRLD